MARVVRPFNREKKKIFSTNGAGYSHEKNKTGPLPNIVCKNSKWIKELNVKTKIMYLLIENIGENIFGNDLAMICWI